jgi:hypothetical protein
MIETVFETIAVYFQTDRKRPEKIQAFSADIEFRIKRLGRFMDYRCQEF